MHRYLANFDIKQNICLLNKYKEKRKKKWEKNGKISIDYRLKL